MKTKNNLEYKDMKMNGEIYIDFEGDMKVELKQPIALYEMLDEDAIKKNILNKKILLTIENEDEDWVFEREHAPILEETFLLYEVEIPIAKQIKDFIDAPDFVMNNPETAGYSI